jgi:hypothetical protein
MATPLEMRERQDRILAELCELGLVLARDLQACALAADQASEKADLSLAFQRTSRSVRQTLALESKLERDRRLAEREAYEAVERAETVRAAQRRAQVKLAVERCVWSEAEGDEAETLLADLDDRLERDALSDAFSDDEPVETHIARLCAELGVTPLPSSSPLGGGGGEADGGGFHSDLGGSPPTPWRSSG